METDLPVPDALRVDLAALRRRGIDHHELEAVLPVAWLAKALHDTDASVVDPGQVRLRLLLQPEGVVVAQGSLQVAFAVPCGRCLADASVDGSGEIFATFMPLEDETPVPRDADDDEDGDLDPDDATPDVYRYDGAILQLDGLVAEQVALAYPMRALCTRGEACRGLCSNCGYELNQLGVTERRCPQCHNEVPLTPVADLPVAVQGEDSAPDQRDAREGEGPLAAALRKLQLD